MTVATKPETSPSRRTKPFFRLWTVQLETNFVLKITISSKTESGLDALAMSVRRIRLNKGPLLLAMFSGAPESPHFKTGTTQSIEIGYMNIGRWPTAAFAFHLDRSLLFLNLASAGEPLAHIDKVEKIIQRAAVDGSNSPTECVLSIISYHGDKRRIDGYISFRFDRLIRGTPLRPKVGIQPPDNESFAISEFSTVSVPPVFHPIFTSRINLRYEIEESETDTLLQRFSSLDL